MEAKGFSALIIYLLLLLFSHSLHRYNVSLTKAPLTLTIQPSDPRQSAWTSNGLDTKLCCNIENFSELLAIKQRNHRARGRHGPTLNCVGNKLTLR